MEPSFKLKKNKSAKKEITVIHLEECLSDSFVVASYLRIMTSNLGVLVLSATCMSC